MDIAAIPAIARVAAPYPARVPLIDETRPAWATPRAAEAAESPPAPQPARSRDQAPPAPIAGMAPRPDPDLLRDQYAEARMRRAIADYAAAPAEAAARANDWGTIEGLAPLQPYRLAMPTRRCRNGRPPRPSRPWARPCPRSPASAPRKTPPTRRATVRASRLSLGLSGRTRRSSSRPGRCRRWRPGTPPRSSSPACGRPAGP